MKKNILLIFGGESVEHDISVITALQTLKNIDSIYNVVPIYIAKNGTWLTAENMQDVSIYHDFMKKGKKVKFATLISGKPYIALRKNNKYSKFINVNFALLCTHGKHGEDGALQGMLYNSHIPYSSCDVKSSAIIMDKIFMKDVLLSRKLPYLPYVSLVFEEYVKNKDRYINQIVSKLKFPLILKPANLGSSIGIKICYEKKDIKNYIDFCFRFDNRILVEKYLPDITEYNCACVHMNNDLKISSIQKVEKSEGIYSFEDKYLKEGVKKVDKIDKSLTLKIKNLTEKVYRAFGCYGVIRVDFIYDNVMQKLYVNEINSIPGSMAFYLFKDLRFKDLIDCLIEEGLERFKNEQFVSAYDSDALTLFEKIDFTSKQK